MKKWVNVKLAIIILIIIVLAIAIINYEPKIEVSDNDQAGQEIINEQINNETNNNASQIVPAEEVSGKQYSVRINEFAFILLTTKIKVGDTVTWTNEDSATHTVTSNEGKELESGPLTKGKTYNHKFTAAGTYKYHCAFHPGMKGVIIVE